MKVEIRLPAVPPNNPQAAVEVATSKGDDGVGAAHGPEHAGLFQAGTDHSLAAAFNHTRTDEQVLRAKPGVAHAPGISLKVIRLGTKFLQNFDAG